MTDSSEVFVISKEFLARVRRVWVPVIPTILIFMCLIALVVAEFDAKTVIQLIPYWLVIAAIIVISAVFIGRDSLTAWDRMRLYVGAGGLRVEDGSAKRDVSWDTIIKVRIRHNPSGEARSIDVFPAGGRSLTLQGFGPMPDILALIQSRVPPTAQLLSIQQRVDRENPLVLSAILLVIALIVTAVLQVGGWKGFFVMNNIFMAVAGVWLVWYGPISRTRPQDRKWEVAVGILALGCSVSSFVFKAVLKAF